MKKLVIYLMAEPETPELARAAVDGGADIVELGFPFSDPLADGPVIRRAAERALSRGMRTRACLDILRQTHELAPETPLIPMTYSSLLEAYGWERFADDVQSAGGASMIIADLPVDERPETRRVQLVAPTSTDEEALRAFRGLARTEGIIPALEPAHALARARELDAELILVCLSGRGDKDLAEALIGLEKLS